MDRGCLCQGSGKLSHGYRPLQITELSLHNFRCYEHIALELPSGLNVLVGSNASGKTSLLEAVLLLTTTSSPRTNHDYELVRWDCAWGRASGQFVSSQQQALSVAITLRGQGKAGANEAALPAQLSEAKHIEVGGRRCNSAVEVVGQAPTVFFSPDDLQVIKGSPGVRRRLLNMAIAQITPRYLDDLRRYRRALAQRNELLKQVTRRETDGAAVAPWTSQLIDSGVRISADRERFLEQLGRAAAEVHKALTGGAEQLETRYRSVLAGAGDDQEREAVFRQQLEKQWPRELQLGATQVGPHRDEVTVTVNGRVLRQFGSQGQQRTAALAVKLAEAQVIAQRRDELPILLLDDCLSELDPRRAGWLLETGAGFDQVLVTSAAASDVLRASNWAAWHELSEGTIKQAQRETGIGG